MKKYTDTEQFIAITRITFYRVVLTCGKCGTDKLFPAGPATGGLVLHQYGYYGPEVNCKGAYPQSQTQVESL